jgi:hypothetical protein
MLQLGARGLSHVRSCHHHEKKKKNEVLEESKTKELRTARMVVPKSSGPEPGAITGGKRAINPGL